MSALTEGDVPPAVEAAPRAPAAAVRAFTARNVLLGLGLLALALLPAAVDEFWTRFAARLLAFGLAAVAVDFLLGYAGLVSFGHAAFLGVGAYATGVLTNAGYESAFVAWPMAMLVAAAAAFIVGALSLRSTGLYFIMITLAFAQMIFYALQSLRALGGDDGFAMTRNTFGGWLDPYDGASLYYVTLALTVGITALLARVVRSEFGVALRAARDNDGRVHALGLPSLPYRLAAFTASGAVAGLAGALLANLSGHIAPSMASWQASGELLVMVLIGGAGTLVGGLVGAAVLLGLTEVLSDLTEHWMFYLGILIVLRALFLRRGFVALLTPGVRRG